MREELLKLDLQFFADGEGSETSEGVTETEPAEQSTETVSEGAEDTGVNDVEPTEPQPQSAETNRAFAEMRRRMEAAERKAADIDAIYAKQFGAYSNPETGQPIRSAKDYADAMAAQERIRAREQLKENNIDPALIDNMIANSPVVRQAQEATNELNSYRAQKQLDEDLKKILTFDNRFSSIEELKADPSMMEVAEYVVAHPGVRADEAYKIINYERLTSSNGAAAKQAAINSIKGKNHLATGAALNVDDNTEDIPAAQLQMYKDAFPDKTLKEIKSLYNKAIGLRR